MTAKDLWKPSSSDFINNPYPVYDQLRSFGPVFQSNSGDYVIIGYEECKQILHDPICISGLRKDWVHKMVDYSNDKGEDFEALREAVDGMLVQMNNPKHLVVRSMMSKSWPSVARIKDLASSLSQELINDLPESFDAMPTLCRMLPLRMICAILGLPSDKAADLMQDGLKLVQILDPYQSWRDLKEIHASTRRLHTFIANSIAAPGFKAPPLTQSILEFELDERDHLDPVSMLIFLFFSGFETTSTLISSCIHQLLLNKELAQEFNNTGIQPYVREILRLNSPVQITGRLTTREIELSRTTIPPGSTLTVCIAAANLDPNHFEEPYQIKLNRKKDHLSFGYGMHHCLGSQLAELEAEILLQHLLEFIPQLELAGQPQLENKLTIRSYQSLPLRFI